MTNSANQNKMEQFVRDELDRRAIYDVQTRYCYLADTGQGDLIADEIFGVDAVEDHGGIGRTLKGRDEIRSAFTGLSEIFEAVFHNLGNIHIVLNGDEAFGRFNFMAYHWMRETEHLGPLRPADFVLAGAYLNDFKRYPEEGWRIFRQRLHGYGPNSTGLVAGQMPKMLRAGIGKLLP